MTQYDREQQGAPQDLHGIVVASFAACAPQGIQQGVIGDCCEEGAYRLQGGRVFESIPGEQRFGDGDFHGGLRGGRADTGDNITTQQIPK